MTISPPEREVKARVVVDKNPVPTSFEKWSKPGHFDRTLAKGQKPPLGFGTSTLTLTTLTVIQVT